MYITYYKNEDAARYDKLKETLLKIFDMTEREFRKKFRYSSPQKSETFMNSVVG